jgi:D-alanine-D-alanine ligase
MGSSVGVSKVTNRKELEDAIEKALVYDRRIIAEQAIKGRELEIGIIGNSSLSFSAVGEIVTENEYYDYDSKYSGSGTRLFIPADVDDGVRREVEELAEKAYRALDGEGFARVDLFYDEGRGSVYLNEMNAIPGFTRFSMFPMMWQEAGVGYTELIERIIELGYERHNAAYHR